MHTQGPTRRLVAIVIADVVDYSRLMERDESGTYARLKKIREEILDPKIAAYGGRIVDTAGDGLLLEFPSASASIRWAIDVQRELDNINRNVAQGERLQFRVGINSGDIIVDGDRIAGSGVNVAARLQTLAAAGGICISSSIREQVHEDFGARFVDIGEQHVKNISRPIRAFRVEPIGGPIPAADRFRAAARYVLQRSATVRLAVLLLGLVAAAAFWYSNRAEREVATAPPLSVAILPFSGMNESTQAQVVDGAFTEELTLAMARGAWGHVIAYPVARTYTDKPVDMLKIGREVNARYIVSGGLKQGANGPVLSADVVDSIEGVRVWSENFGIDGQNLAQERRRLLTRLTLELRSAIVNAELRRLGNPPPPGTTAIELALHARSVWNRDPNSLKGARAARRIYDEALRIDPNSVQALLGRARALTYELDLNPHADHDKIVLEIDELSKRAVSMDGNNAQAWIYRAEALLREWRWDAALEATFRAERLDSARAEPLRQRALVMIYTGKPEEALALIDQSLGLGTGRAVDVGWAILERCVALVALGRYNEAVTACEKSIAHDDWWFSHLYLMAAYAMIGDDERGQAERRLLLDQQPGFTIADFEALKLSNDPQFWQQTRTYLYAGLRKAGIPER